MEFITDIEDTSPPSDSSHEVENGDAAVNEPPHIDGPDSVESKCENELSTVNDHDKLPRPNPEREVSQSPLDDKLKESLLSGNTMPSFTASSDDIMESFPNYNNTPAFTTSSDEIKESLPNDNDGPTFTTASVIPCILCQAALQPEGPFTPYLLECGHILCAECLSNVSSINDASSVHQLIPPTTLKCSDCFCMSSLPLSKHYPLIRTFIKQMSDETADIVCKVCNSQQAVIECTDCQFPLCEDCDEEMHNADMETEEHIRELIDLNTLCLEHCKPQQVYCFTCSIEVCPDCVAVGSHSQHHCQERQDLLEEQNHSLNELVSSTESNLLAAVSLTQQVQEALPNKAKSKNAINKAFEEIHASLHARRQQLLQQIDETAELQTQQCNALLTKLSEIKSDCEGSICELNERQVLQTSQSSTENIGQQTLLVSRKDSVIPAEEYAAIMEKLEMSSSYDVAGAGPVPSVFTDMGPTLAIDVANMQEMIAKLGTKQCNAIESVTTTEPSGRARTRLSLRVKDETEPKAKAKTKVKTKAKAKPAMRVVEDHEEEEVVYNAPTKKNQAKKRPSAKKLHSAVIHVGRMESGLPFSKLRVGDKIDCLDSSNRWAEAEIIEICRKTKQILVSYLYWGNEWDEWVTDIECGIAPLKTHTYYAGGPLEVGFRVEVLHDGVWREGFVMDTKGDKVKVYYEDFSNTTQQKWVDFRDDCIRQFGLYNKDTNEEDDAVEKHDGGGSGSPSKKNTKKSKKKKDKTKKPTESPSKKRKISWTTDLAL